MVDDLYAGSAEGPCAGLLTLTEVVGMMEIVWK